jgi:hypothetical protein
VNEQASVMIRWLLAGHGGLKNIAQLLTDGFGPAGIAAASLDNRDGTIMAYPVEPSQRPYGGRWTEVAHGWTHPFDPPSMPHSATADHHVVVGITSRNEMLVVNLHAAAYLGIEGAAPIPIMRSWMMQILSTTPTAHVAVTDPALHLPDTPRVAFTDTIGAAPASTTILFTTEHTSAPESPTPLLISSKAVDCSNDLLCEDAVSGIYIANRYWPLWRRLELPDPQWNTVAAAITPTSAAAPAIPTPPAASAPAAQDEPATAHQDNAPAAPDVPVVDVAPPDPERPETAAAAAHGDDAPTGDPTLVAELPTVIDPAPEVIAQPESDVAADESGPNTEAVIAAEDLPLLAADSAAPPVFVDEPATETNAHSLPGPPPPPPAPERTGIYGLGETYVCGADPATGAPVKHTATTRHGSARKPVMALMMLATAPEHGLARQQWDDMLHTSPANRRQVRTQIKKMLGGAELITIDPVSERLVVPELFCDWKEFQRLIGDNPMTAATDNLVAAVTLVRGEPFSDLPHAEYNWRDYVLLKDELVTQCGDAAMELARRYQANGHHEAAYRTARTGISADPRREDLWTVAMATAPEPERRGLLYDLKEAIPVPASSELRKLLHTAQPDYDHTRKAHHA